MKKIIKTLDDLEKIAGSELKQIHKIHHNKDNKEEIKNFIPSAKKLKRNKKIKTKSFSPVVNVLETGIIELNNKKINIDNEKRKLKPINDYIRNIKKENLLSFIKEEERLAKHFTDCYLAGIERNENNIGYILVVINIYRTIKTMKKRLQELEKNT